MGVGVIMSATTMTTTTTTTDKTQTRRRAVIEYNGTYSARVLASFVLLLTPLMLAISNDMYAWQTTLNIFTALSSLSFVKNSLSTFMKKPGVQNRNLIAKLENCLEWDGMSRNVNDWRQKLLRITQHANRLEHLMSTWLKRENLPAQTQHQQHNRKRASKDRNTSNNCQEKDISFQWVHMAPHFQKRPFTCQECMSTYYRELSWAGFITATVMKPAALRAKEIPAKYPNISRVVRTKINFSVVCKIEEGKWKKTENGFRKCYFETNKICLRWDFEGKTMRCFLFRLLPDAMRNILRLLSVELWPTQEHRKLTASKSNMARVAV